MTINAPGPAPTVDPARLAPQHLPLVAHLLHDTLRRVPAAVDRHDLLAVGVDALLAAAREPTVERPFAEHASVRIRAALGEELRAIDWAARAEHPRHAAPARARPLAALADLPDAGAAARVLDV
ncbi:MAG: FliA/WhiG family RNA polymerase sigma factor, partial [Nocardioides sp.]|nr:FliA/WhiG family RNA polymerase sigma factor [Nocardioides sp.]